MLNAGVPWRLVRTRRPPVIVNSDSSRMMNGKYSSRAVCSASYRASSKPNRDANGTRNAAAQAALTLPKWWCQKLGASSGKSAIESRMPTNGTAHSRPSSPPSRCGA